MGLLVVISHFVDPDSFWIFGSRFTPTLRAVNPEPNPRIICGEYLCVCGE